MISLISNIAKTHTATVSNPNQRDRGVALKAPLAQDTFMRSSAQKQAQPSFGASLKVPKYQIPFLEKINKLTEVVDELGEKHAEATEDEFSQMSEEAAEIALKLADKQSELARTYLDLGPDNAICMQNAFRLAMDATKLVPEHSEARFVCGILEGDPKVAYKHFTIALKGDPKNIEYLEQRAYAAEEAKNPKAAILDFTKLIDLDPRNVDHRLRRGMLMANAGDVPGALKDFDHVIEVAPHNYKSYLSKGFVFFNEGKFAEAAQNYQKAVERNPQGEDLAIAYCNLGSSHYECQNFAPAIKAFTSSIEIEPVPAILEKRAMSNMFLDKYDEAIKDAEMAKRAGLQDSEPTSLQVFCLKQLGRHNEADSLLTRAEDTFLEFDYDFRSEIDVIAKQKADFDAKSKGAQK